MKYIICFVLLLTGSAAYACDVCGASSGNQSLGLLPQTSFHFAGVQYKYSSFNSRQYALKDNTMASYAKEYYQSMQLWGRYCIGNRWQLFGFVPYSHNIYQNADSAVHTKGIGDVTILLNYVFIQTADSNTSLIRHRLQAGTGIKAPTGAYAGITDRERSGLPNMQAGTGSWDFPVNVNYTLRYGSFGVNTDLSYNITTANKNGYKYGDKLGTQLSLFYLLSAGQVNVIPQLALNNEYTLHDYENYSKKWLNEDSGGNILSVRVGAQLYFKRIGMQVLYSRPVHQDFGGGNIAARNKIDAGIMYLF